MPMSLRKERVVGRIGLEPITNWLRARKRPFFRELLHIHSASQVFTCEGLSV